MQILREYLFAKECREKIYNGVKLMERTVGATLGPYGRNVLIDHAKQIVDLTKDGVTVAEEVTSPDPWTEMGCKIAKVASQKTNEEAGDATTTTVVLVEAMCREGMDIPSKARILSVKRGMQLACDKCVDYILKNAVQIKKEEDFRKVATIASQDDEIGRTVTSAFMASGENGSIEIERDDEPGIHFEKTDGISFNKGYVLPHCINQPNNKVIQEEIPILVTDREIKNQHMIVPIMEKLAKDKGTVKLVVIADEFRGDTLGMMAKNCSQHAFHVIPIRAPYYGKNKIETLKDIAEATGATFISEENSGIKLERAELSMLGMARKITVERERTVIVSPDNVEIKKRISDRIDTVKAWMDEEKDEIILEDLRTRLATLTDGITVLHVGGHTEQERRELQHRVQDAVKSLQSAREEGVVPGCGVMFLRSLGALEGLTDDPDEMVGVTIVRRSLLSPSLKILEVAGIEGKEFIVEEMKKTGNGYCFKTGKLVDMMETGVYDSAKAMRCALQNAVSTAKSFLSTEVAINQIEDSDDLWARVGAKLKRN